LASKKPCGREELSFFCPRLTQAIHYTKKGT